MNRAERRAQARAERRVQVSPHWRRRLMTKASDAWRSERARIDAGTLDEAQQRDLATPKLSRPRRARSGRSGSPGAQC